MEGMVVPRIAISMGTRTWFRHGKNVLAYTIRESFSGDRMVVVGYDTKARPCEVIGLRKPYGWLLIHAMTPPTDKTRHEIAEGRRRW